ncbi:unnamed protein product [Rotaria sp. Silwood2]|nr:unnamed protein product [Rotaria sp. Silwood2]
MMKDNNVFCRLDTCETVGYATTICCNIIETLTTNYMTVIQVYVGDKHWKNIENPAKAIEIIIPTNTKKIIVENISVNCSYSSKLLPSLENETFLKQIGNKTECSLSSFADALDGNYDEIRTHYPEVQFVHVYPFNSVQKSMSTFIRRFDSTVHIVPFSNVDYDRLVQTVIEPMAFDGLCTICLAYRDFSPDRLPDWDDETNIMDQLTLPEVIAKCQNAGITVRMITGDNVNTARSIAFKCGIISPNDSFLILEGEELNRRIRPRLDEEIYLTIHILVSLVFTFEVPTKELLTRKPYGRTPPLISRTMMKNIIDHSIYQLAVILFILFAEGPKFSRD